MSVLTFAANDLFIFRTFKSLTTNPANKWVNSYEFRAIDTGTTGDLITLASTIVTFESAMSLETTNFERVVISTWEADSVPYDPDAFYALSLTDVGQVNLTTDPIALNTCQIVTRQATSGRFGHLFFRNWLVEGDVGAPAGKSVLVDRPAKQTLLDDALESSTLQDYIGVGAGGAFNMVMVNATGTNVRIVTALRVQGVTTLPQDHAWFNRTTGP